MMVTQDSIKNFKIHPLGFYYLVLLSGEVTSRLHVYSPSVDFKMDNQWHTHGFDLNSKIVVGSIQNLIGQFIVDGEKNLQEFAVEYDAEKSILNATGNWGMISKLVEFTTTAEQTYFIKAGTLHRVKNIETPCVTYVETKDQGCKIFSYGSTEAPFNRRKVNADEALEISNILTQNGLISNT